MRITSGYVQHVLQDFYDDEYSVQWNGGWLVRTLKVPTASSGEHEDVTQIFETAVGSLVADLHACQQGDRTHVVEACLGSFSSLPLDSRRFGVEAKGTFA